VRLSVIGSGGTAVAGMEQARAGRTVVATVAGMDRMKLDSVPLPVNFVCFG
jgi:hypothetical protein